MLLVKMGTNKDVDHSPPSHVAHSNKRGNAEEHLNGRLTLKI